MSDHMHDNGIKEGARGYQTSDGQWHDTMSDARVHQNSGGSDGGVAEAGAKAMGNAVGPLIALAAVFFIIQVAIKQYALYVLPAGGIVLLVCVSQAFFGIKKATSCFWLYWRR